MVNNRGVPYFKTPKGGDVEAALFIGGVPSEELTPGDPATLVTPLKLAGTPVLTSVGYATEGNLPSRVDPQTGGSGVELLGDGGLSLYTPEAPDPDAGKTIKLFLTTGNIDGWCTLAVDIPLTAYYDEANPEATAGHDVWRLRTGVNYHQLDYGPVSAASYSPGGLTLLRVGNPVGGGILITGLNPVEAALYKTAARVPLREAGETFNSALAWLAAPGNAEDGVDYYLTLHASVASGPRTLSFGGAAGASLTLESGDGAPRTIQLNANGSLFTVNAGRTLTLGNGVTLKGKTANNAPVVLVTSGGAFNILNGARITGNVYDTDRGGGGGVRVTTGGTVTMSGGVIDFNVQDHGGGVSIIGSGTFIMTGGIIRDNEVVALGGGVDVRKNGTFKMYGGEISRNRVNYTRSSSAGGGGVNTAQSGSFEMHGGRIVNNTVRGGATGFAAGGGIFIQGGGNAQVKIYKGEITGNDAPDTGGPGGGGIYVYWPAGAGSGTGTLTFPTTMPGGGPSGPVVIGGNTTGSVRSPNSFNV
ncbi:MAG: hypothetical protein LBG84_01310, partial [Treponema sp.]|nr:hypothetical protein [Treponema sp.]